MRLFLLMAMVTAIEVVLIAKVGSMIGFFPTLFIIIGTAFLGSRLLSKQWRFVMGKLQSLQGNPSDALLEALVLVISGVLLVTPGFLTDILGFLGLIPATRAHFVALLRKQGAGMIKGSFTSYSSSSTSFGQRAHHQHQQDNVIEGEFERKED